MCKERLPNAEFIVLYRITITYIHNFGVKSLWIREHTVEIDAKKKKAYLYRTFDRISRPSFTIINKVCL